MIRYHGITVTHGQKTGVGGMSEFDPIRFVAAMPRDLCNSGSLRH